MDSDEFDLNDALDDLYHFGYRKGIHMEDREGTKEVKDLIIAAFAELRQERDKLSGEASHNLAAYYDTLKKLNAEHLKLINAEASESNWRAVAKRYKLVLFEIYASGSPDDRFWQLAMNALLAEGDDWRKI